MVRIGVPIVDMAKSTRMTHSGHAQSLLDNLLPMRSRTMDPLLRMNSRFIPGGLLPVFGSVYFSYAALFAGAAPSVAPICFSSVSISK
jgi:hypothetical protein